MSNQENNHTQHSTKKSNNRANSDQLVVKKSTPMIVDRVYKYPMINMAITLGYTQYDKLKSSSVTVGEVMTRAEGLAVYFWQKVAPIVEKFQEPINKADRLACDTLDFIEGRIVRVVSPHS